MEWVVLYCIFDRSISNITIVNTSTTNGVGYALLPILLCLFVERSKKKPKEKRAMFIAPIGNIEQAHPMVVNLWKSQRTFVPMETIRSWIYKTTPDVNPPMALLLESRPRFLDSSSVGRNLFPKRRTSSHYQRFGAFDAFFSETNISFFSRLRHSACFLFGGTGCLNQNRERHSMKTLLDFGAR